jgi:hypothetical protein
MMHLGKDVRFSTESCYFTKDKELAGKFLEVVKKFQGKGHIYKTVELQRRNVRARKRTGS